MFSPELEASPAVDPNERPEAADRVSGAMASWAAFDKFLATRCRACGREAGNHNREVHAFWVAKLVAGKSYKAGLKIRRECGLIDL